MWSSAPFLPQINGARYDSADGPAAVLPDGKILLAASPGDFATPTHFWVFDGTSLTQARDNPTAANDSSFFSRMLVLPTGQILVDDGSQVDLFTEDAKAPSQWAPVVSSLSSTTLTPGTTYTVQGNQLSGLTQGAGYGDDYQANTNYPLVRVTNKKTGVVTYGRTMNMSSFSIAPGAASSAQFVLPATTPTGPSKLVVVANGNASAPVSVQVS